MQTSKHISTSNEQIWMHVFPHPAYKWLYLWNSIRYEHVTSIKLLLKARALIWYPIEIRLNKVCETKWQIWGFMYTLLAYKGHKGQIRDGPISQNTFHELYKLCIKFHAFIKKCTIFCYAASLHSPLLI